MTTESGSDSESKDKEQDQQESPTQQGAAETQPQDQQQLSEEHHNALEQFSAVAAHSTPVKKEQVREPPHACLLHHTSYLPPVTTPGIKGVWCARSGNIYSDTCGRMFHVMV